MNKCSTLASSFDVVLGKKSLPSFDTTSLYSTVLGRILCTCLFVYYMVCVCGDCGCMYAQCYDGWELFANNIVNCEVVLH